MTDAQRIQFARIISAHERITQLAKHKAIPVWVSRSLQEITAEADSAAESLRSLIESRG